MKYVVGICIGIVLAAGGYYAFKEFPAMAENWDWQWQTRAPGNTEDNTSTEKSAEETKADDNEPIAEAVYLCENERTVRAVYFNNKVIVELSDGRAAQLSQIATESGIRYENTGGSLIFWSRGVEAFVEENGEETFTGCAELDTSSVEAF